MPIKEPLKDDVSPDRNQGCALTLYDHIHAVRRHPQFIKEATALQLQLRQLERSKAKDAQLVQWLSHNVVAERWNVPTWIVLGAGAMPMTRLRKDDEGNEEICGTTMNEMWLPDPNGFSAAATEKELTIPINWKLPPWDIVAWLDTITTLYQRNPMLRRPKGKRDKKTTIDPWLVYDLRTYDKRSLSKIARILFQLDGKAAAHDEELKRRLAQVQRAFMKAKAMIKAVKPDVPSTFDSSNPCFSFHE